MEGSELRDVRLISGHTVLAVDAEGRWFGKSVGGLKGRAGVPQPLRHRALRLWLTIGARR